METNITSTMEVYVVIAVAHFFDEHIKQLNPPYLHAGNPAQEAPLSKITSPEIEHNVGLMSNLEGNANYVVITNVSK